MAMHDEGQALPAPGAIAAAFPAERVALIPLLTEMQRVYGYVSKACLAAAAAHAGIGIEETRAAVTFYPHLRFTPPARQLVRICQGAACHLRGSAAVQEAAESALGISLGAVTPDREFALEPAACLGCCSIAPVLAVGPTIHGPIDAEGVRAVIARCHQEKRE